MLMHTQTYRHIYTQIHNDKHMYTHTYIYTPTQRYTDICIHTYRDTYKTCMQRHTFMQRHTYIFAHTDNTHVNTYIQRCTHVHTCANTCSICSEAHRNIYAHIHTQGEIETHVLRDTQIH